MADKPIGKVAHYYDKIKVAVVDLKSPLSTGDSIKFVKAEDQFTQTVSSMQVDHQEITKAKIQVWVITLLMLIITGLKIN